MAPEPSPDVLVRPATREDATAAAHTLLASRRAAERTGAIPVDRHEDAEVEKWFAEEVMPTREVWVAEQDGACVGVLVLDEAWLDHLYVRPGRNGQGIGSLLLATARALRPAGFDLWVFQSNTGAQRFYERHGLVAVERTEGSANAEQAPDIRYRALPASATPAAGEAISRHLDGPGS